jgi:HD superfamily phosphodiesterase
MNNLQPKLDAFKQIVIENSNNENFTYREWFVKDHLMIVERIAIELCDKHPEADRAIVIALVWFHDFGKSIDEANESEITKTKGVDAMRSVGLPEEFVQTVLNFWTRMEMKNEIDISQEAMEVQIISTADGASHFVGKFYSSYFGDMPRESMATTEKILRKKITKDWERKIVLPEVKKAFLSRYHKALEIVGEYPEKSII